MDCNQEQKIPLTPIAELHKWNNTIVYMHEDFLKRMINKTTAAKAKAKSSTSLDAAAKSQTGRPTATKSKAEVETKEEEDEEQYVDAAVWIGDDVEMVMEELTYSAHNQSCHVGTDNFFWKCNHQDCPVNCAEINQNTVAGDLCPQCSGKPINTTSDPQETELQCTNFCVQPTCAHVRAPPAVLEDGQIQHHGTAVLSGCWLKNIDEHYFHDEIPARSSKLWM